MSHPLTAQAFRGELLSPVAFHRVKALHALECQAHLLEGTPQGKALVTFVSRGIPYFSQDSTHYAGWVDQAVAYWELVSQKAGLAVAA